MIILIRSNSGFCFVWPVLVAASAFRMAKGRATAAKGKAHASKSSKVKAKCAAKRGKGQLTVAEQVRQRLRETFRDMSGDETHMICCGNPPRTMAEQLSYDLEQSEAGFPVQFGKLYNDRIRMMYTIKSEDSKKLSYSPPAKEVVNPAAGSADDEVVAMNHEDQTTDVTPALLRVPFFVFLFCFSFKFEWSFF